jgi:hypothetical protein
VFNKAQLKEKQEARFKIELIVEDNRGEKGEACKVITVTDPEI